MALAYPCSPGALLSSALVEQSAMAFACAILPAIKDSN
jgi:hypothetical protein